MVLPKKSVTESFPTARLEASPRRFRRKRRYDRGLNNLQRSSKSKDKKGDKSSSKKRSKEPKSQVEGASGKAADASGGQVGGDSEAIANGAIGQQANQN